MNGDCQGLILEFETHVKGVVVVGLTCALRIFLRVLPNQVLPRTARGASINMLSTRPHLSAALVMQTQAASKVD